MQVADVLTNDGTLTPLGSGVVVGDPLFVDMPHGNYHLSATKLGNTIVASPAIDFAPPDAAVPAHDVNGRPRDQDIVAIADLFGVRDLGAYEMQPINDRIFADGFGNPISQVY